MKNVCPGEIFSHPTPMFGYEQLAELCNHSFFVTQCMLHNDCLLKVNYL